MSSRRAVTFIELLLVITIMGIATIFVSTNAPRIKNQVLAEREFAEIEEAFRELRVNSMGERWLNGTESLIDHYEWEIRHDQLNAIAIAENGQREILSTITLLESHVISPQQSLYFFPGTGEFCIDTIDYPACKQIEANSGDDERRFTVNVESDPSLSAEFVISTVNGTLQRVR